MKKDWLRNEIHKNLENQLKILNEQRINDLSYQVIHGSNYSKRKYYNENFYYSNILDKNDFYWDENDKCYYMKDNIDIIKYEGCKND